MYTSINTDKRGIIRTFITIICAVIFLSRLGFDLRSHVEKFQGEHGESINTAKTLLFETILPASGEVFNTIKQITDGEFSKEDFDALINEYGEAVPEFQETFLNSKFIPAQTARDTNI